MQIESTHIVLVRSINISSLLDKNPGTLGVATVAGFVELRFLQGRNDFPNKGLRLKTHARRALPNL